MLAAIYLRLSRDEEQKGLEEVLSNHRIALIKLAEQHNLQHDLYQEVSSGMDVERPQLNLLLKNIRDYDYILVMDVDRLTRDNVHAEQLKKIFMINDIKILTPSGEIDFTNESNELLYSFSSLLANYEWKQIRNRLGRGRLAAAAQGKWVMSNKVPLGYDKNSEKKLVIREDEVRIIRLIFERTLQGYSATQISKELDALNWRSRQGKVITTSHISQIRRNCVYYGCISMKRRINGKVVDEVFVEGAHEGIVTKQQFFEAQDVVGGRGFEFRQKGVAKRKLHGLIYCNCCGRRRYIQKDGNGVEYIKSCSYKVDNNICEDRGAKYKPIEEAVLREIKKLKHKVEKELERIKIVDTIRMKNQLLEQKSELNCNLNRISNRQKRLTIMRSDGEITKQEFEELKNDFKSQVEQIKKQMEVVAVQLENLSNTDNEQKRMEKVLYTIMNLNELDDVEVNAFLKTIIKKVKFSSNMSSNHNTTIKRVKSTIKLEPVKNNGERHK
ncbi:resolvase [Bacillus clarus]|uniref:Recombinase family protein n=1 Tax=Bacillus clarus TaxID=2338372 RepID=A0A090YKC8_9BACI|nr:recombinase family protein [Bacillus clarus]KFM98919.1 recombinase family protein [Bacillus clarus]RFT67534.1 resolvase [Bacillus clarus]